MGILSWIYNLLYMRKAPWDVGGPRPEVVRAVERGRLQPCKAIDLGCGTGDNVIYLAQNGFDAVGVDLSSRAIAQAQEKAQTAGVSPTFVTGDVTDLREVEGPFDLVLDYGCLGCILGLPTRKKYAATVLRLTRPGSSYILLNFAGGRTIQANFIPNVLRRGEVERLFGRDFQVEHYDGAHERGPLGLPVEFRVMQRT